MKFGILICCFALLGCAKHHRNEAYEFPDGFHGWAVIVWGVPGHPRCPTNEGGIVVRFPTNGVIVTSTHLDLQAVREGAYYLDATGHRLASQPNTAFVGNGFMYENKSRRGMDYTQVFVGTKAEYFACPDAPQAKQLWDSGLSSHEP
jgi:hypothetical protein